MHALITGGAGFIGSHLTEHLVEQGWTVTALDDLSTGSAENLDPVRRMPGGAGVELVRGSVTDSPLVHRLADGADVIFHLAAAVGVLTIQQQTLHSMRTNLAGTETVMEAAQAHGSTVLFTSTSEVYGKNTTIGLREDDDRVMGSPLLSRWSYAEAKAIDETLVQQYHLHHGVPSVIVRLFNTTGPRQAGRYGMVVPRFVRQALTGEPLTVYGTGQQTRCFGHVHDMVPMIATLAQTPAALGSVYNIGNPEQISITGLAERVIARTGSSSDITYVDYQSAYGPGYEDMERRVPDCTRLTELTGFRPRHDLDDIIDDVAAHISGRRSVPADRVPA
ncbi:GDP-mannose 4,6-dehydratase [Janibacter alkaliphilus]|uniref:UDP-glucose 4-epimerase n=1 Tax=Janibacter alkaliphilus TaxID=1069963 RepID=A0A852X376_9MICO|nr:NAD-dependent epimerase/dehydratase family protein [Janibacter alkaliphilus]NYG35740.1 UDP-glucose 4-epimerase [Janibacter alkaliphilus]